MIPRRKKLLWQIYPVTLAAVLLALLGVTWYITGELREFHMRQTSFDLQARARLLAPLLQDRFSADESPYVDALCKRLGGQTSTRITVVLPTGLVIGDSDEDPRRMDNHGERPEIAAAFDGEIGTALRFSHTLGHTLIYVAVPVVERGSLIGCVRTALPLTAIGETLDAIYLRIVGGGVAIALLIAMLSWWLTRWISRPLEELKRGAARFARGDLGRPLKVDGSEEIASLAEAMNRMAVQLDDRINTVVRQGSEREAMLSSMVEGVLAVDAEERIIRLNQAAARLLGILPEGVHGRPIQEVVRRAGLHRFVQRALAAEEPVEGDISLIINGRDHFLQAHGTVLRDRGGARLGVLVVLNDVTRLRRLENVRRDFVANVSHELKTPITAIKGSAETLVDGAGLDSEGARRFLEIIVKQADRLNAIIDDLLALARIEQGVDSGGILLERGDLLPVLEGAVQTCSLPAGDKNVQLHLDCPAGVDATINAPLLEQAVVNLLTNAIKYSDEGGRVDIRARREQGRVEISVEDHGCGIAQEHLPRLFERFYRADKARSRKLGGTGLGLAIVKHITQAHGGEVKVESVPDKGSVFTILIPG